MRSLFSSFWFGILAAIVGGAVAGTVDLVNSEVQPAVFIILVFSAILGFLQPERAWVWGLIFGVSILAAHTIAGQFGIHPAYNVEPNLFATLIALIPAFIGAYAGAGIRWISQPKAM